MPQISFELSDAELTLARALFDISSIAIEASDHVDAWPCGKIPENLELVGDYLCRIAGKCSDILKEIICRSDQYIHNDGQTDLLAAIRSFARGEVVAPTGFGERAGEDTDTSPDASPKKSNPASETPATPPSGGTDDPMVTEAGAGAFCMTRRDYQVRNSKTDKMMVIRDAACLSLLDERRTDLPELSWAEHLRRVDGLSSDVGAQS